MLQKVEITDAGDTTFLAGEQVDAMESEEGRLQDLLGDARSTLEVGDRLTLNVERTLSSVDSLSRRLDLDFSDEREPVDLEAVRAVLLQASETVAEVDGLVGSIEALLTSPGWEERQPQLLELVQSIEQSGEHLVDLAFRRAVLLLVLGLTGLLLVLLLYRVLAPRLSR